LGRFHPAHKLIGAAGSIGAGAPTQLPCDTPTVLRDIQDHSLMAVAAVKFGSIDPSASNRHRINVSHPSKTCSWDCWCRGPKTWHMRGAGGPSPGQVWSAVASCGRLWPAAAGSSLAAAGFGQLRPSLAKLRCGAAGPSQLQPALHLWFGATL
jgi:hypothetical protein